MEKKWFDISNKTIFLTGALGLVGRGLTHALLSENCNVVICGHSISSIEEYKYEFIGVYPKEKILLLQLDITNKNSILECIKEAIIKFKTIDVLINNAAIDCKFDTLNKNKNLAQTRFEDYPIKNIKKSIDVNTIGTIQVTQCIIKQFLKQDFGNIINVGSIYSLLSPNQNLYQIEDEKPQFKSIDYVASKSFIPNFTKYIASLYAVENIRCNAIYFHGIENKHSENFKNNFAKFSPMKRMANTNDILGAFIFLCSDSSKYMTGSDLVIDGGWSII